MAKMFDSAFMTAVDNKCNAADANPSSSLLSKTLLCSRVSCPTHAQNTRDINRNRVVWTFENNLLLTLKKHAVSGIYISPSSE